MYSYKWYKKYLTSLPIGPILPKIPDPSALRQDATNAGRQGWPGNGSASQSGKGISPDLHLERKGKKAL
jgi:hypothetical protein